MSIFNPKTAAESYQKRFYDRILGAPSGADVLTIVRTLTSEDEKRRINGCKFDAFLNKPLYELKDIKEHYCLSWNDLRRIVIAF